MVNYTKGSGNVFKDMGCKNPEEKMAKAELAFIINRIIEEKELTLDEATRLSAVDQSEIFSLKNGELTAFSLEKLFSILGMLDQQIDIVIRNKSENINKAMIHVAYA